MSAQQFEDFAGAFDHLLLQRTGIEKFQAVVEAHPIADDAAQHELRSVIGNQELENHTRSRLELSRQKEAHAAPADVGSLSAKVHPLTVEEYSHAYRKHDSLAFPTPIILLRIRLRFWPHCLHAVFNVSHPVLSDNPTTVTKA